MSQVFCVARSLLDAKAPSFMSTVDPIGYVEGMAVELTDVRIKVFEYFVKWLDMAGPSIASSHWELGFHIYVFGNAYGIPALFYIVQEQILAAARSIKDFVYLNLSLWAASDLVVYVYGNIPELSPLRIILVDLFCLATGPRLKFTSLSNTLKRYPKDFLVDVMVWKHRAASIGSYPNVYQQHIEHETVIKRKRLE
jgi:hypothetical protein